MSSSAPAGGEQQQQQQQQQGAGSDAAAEDGLARLGLQQGEGTPAAAAAAAGPAAAAAAAGPAVDEGPPHPSGLSLEERFQLCRGVAEECISDAELRNLLKHRPHPIAYDGFEPSGRMHIAQGVMKAINVNRLTRAGCHFKFWVADWFAQLNNKMGGDLKKIQTVGKYMVEVRACVRRACTHACACKDQFLRFACGGCTLAARRLVLVGAAS